MASKVVAIAHGRSALQLGLTGLRVQETANVAEVEKVLADLIDSDAQVVIVDEHYRREFSEWMTHRIGRHTGLPLIIFVPGFEAEDAGTDAYINAILKPAVGFEIRLD